MQPTLVAVLPPINVYRHLAHEIYCYFRWLLELRKHLDANGDSIINPSRGHLARKFGVTKKHIGNVLRAMRDAGWITSLRTGRACRYFILCLVAKTQKFLSRSSQRSKRQYRTRASEENPERQKHHGADGADGRTVYNGSSGHVTCAKLKDDDFIQAKHRTFSQNRGPSGQRVAKGRDGLLTLLQMAEHCLAFARNPGGAFMHAIFNPRDRWTTLEDEDRAKSRLRRIDERSAPPPPPPRAPSKAERDAAQIERMLHQAEIRCPGISSLTRLAKIKRAMLTDARWTEEHWTEVMKHVSPAAQFGGGIAAWRPHHGLTLHRC